jgi:nucleotide-binding universal stress UspA family protein
MPPKLKMVAPIDLDGFPGAAVRQAMHFANSVGGELEAIELTERSSADRLPVSDLILMTPSEADLSPVAWRTSATRRVLDQSRSPVLIAKVRPAPRRYSFACRNILCLVNLDGMDAAVLYAASDLASRSDARLHLVHVVPEATEGLLAWSITPSIRPLSESAAIERLRTEAERLPSVTSFAVHIGPLQRNIVRSARETSADLVVVGSAAVNVRSLVKGLNCPVLSIPMHLEPSRLIERPAEGDVADHAEVAGIVMCNVGEAGVSESRS